MKKENSIYNIKNAFELKDMDSEKKQVAVYLSKFDIIDSDNDIIRRGAFTKSIQERGPNSGSNRQIAFLRWHDWEKPIGKFLDLQEDEKGLFAVGQLGNSTIGNDAWNDYADGIIREHSIGFKYLSDKMKWIEDPTQPNGGYWNITELMLFEGSAVTFGANEFTNVVDVMKSENKTDYIEKMTGEIDTLIKALSNGKGSDERLFEMEMKLKYLNGQLITLAKSEPQNVKHSLESKPPIETFNWSDVINNLK
jgi:HK97 family phage prohead protease